MAPKEISQAGSPAASSERGQRRRLHVKPTMHVEAVARLNAARAEAKLEGRSRQAEAGGQEASPVDGQGLQVECDRAQADSRDETDSPRQWGKLNGLLGIFLHRRCCVGHSGHGRPHIWTASTT